MAREETASNEERAARIAREHASRAALGALTFDVISRQAEGRALFAGREYVETRAAEHGVTREAATTDLGNLLGILERGPKEPDEQALVAAFAVAGLGERLGDAESSSSTLARFVRHADFLEMATPYAVLSLLDAVLDEERAGRVWNAVADACLEPAKKEPGRTLHAVRATISARLSALAASSAASARDALSRVAAHASDPFVKALAAWARGGGPVVEGRAGASATAEGRLARAPRGGFVEALRIASGFAVLAWSVRGLGALVGVREPASLELIPGAIRVRSTVALLERKVRERDETVLTSALASVARRARWAASPALVGAASLSLGILAGGLLAFDGARSGETFLLLGAALVVALGAGLDLAIDAWLPGLRGRVAIEIELVTGRRIRVDRVDMEAADRFIEAVERQVTR